jgi:hypothetical protein
VVLADPKNAKRAMDGSAIRPLVEAGYRVLYYEPQSVSDVARCLACARGQGPVQTLILGGSYDLSQLNTLRQSGFWSALAIGANIMLDNDTPIPDWPGHRLSSWFAGGSGADNLANFLATLVPQAKVYAPTQSFETIAPSFDAASRLNGVSYTAGSQAVPTYTVAPSA